MIRGTIYCNGEPTDQVVELSEEDAHIRTMAGTFRADLEPSQAEDSSAAIGAVTASEIPGTVEFSATAGTGEAIQLPAPEGSDKLPPVKKR